MGAGERKRILPGPDPRAPKRRGNWVGTDTSGKLAEVDFNSYWPVYLGIGIPLLLAGLLVYFDVFMIGFVIFAYGVYGWVRQQEKLRPLEGHLLSEKPDKHILAGITTRKMGMWIFLASETMFFSGLIGASLALRAHAHSWPEPGEILNVPLTATNTFILICSSMTMVEALKSIQEGNQRMLRVYILATLLLGMTFIGIQAWEYSLLIHEGLTPSESLYGTAFFTQTGFHGAHVSGGLVALFIVTVKAFKGGYTQDNHEEVELMGLYWHFVDVVWIFLFTIVYLI